MSERRITCDKCWGGSTDCPKCDGKGWVHLKDWEAHETSHGEHGLWYFAHPYTVTDSDGNYVPKAEDANYRICCYRSAQLLRCGYNVYSPIAHTHPIHRASPAFQGAHEHEMWYQLDNQFIERTEWDGIILAPGFEQSTGCMDELETFKERGLPHRYYADIVPDGKPSQPTNQLTN